MRLYARRLAFFSFIPIAITGCQGEPPSFVEQGLAPVTLTVSENPGDDGARGNEFILDESDAEDESTQNTADRGRVSGYSGYTGDDEVTDHASDAAETGTDDAKADAAGAATGAKDTTKGKPLPQDKPLASDDAAGVAAACGRHLKGAATRIRVINAEDALSALQLAPDTALAVRLSGRQSRLSLNLGAGHPLAGICFVLRGHESSVRFTTASDVRKLVYLAAGDASQGDIEVNQASLGGARIEMAGHAPRLTVKGVSASLCDDAILKNKSASIQCLP